MNYSLRVIRESLGGQIITRSAGESPNTDIPRAPDKGCELHRGRCLECPFPHCKKHELAVGKSYDGKNKHRRVN
jgi:hypothetical protein